MRAIVTVPKFHNLPLGEWPMRDFRFGSLATFRVAHSMSALPPKADISRALDVAPESLSCIITPMDPRGLYRERNGWGNQHSARVKYDEHQELDIPEDKYRARGYQPPFDRLPWKDEAANDV